MSRPTAIDLFCGAGGLSLGLEQAGFDVVAAVDCDTPDGTLRERINCQTHKLNFPDCPTVCHDITELTAASLRQIAEVPEIIIYARISSVEQSQNSHALEQQISNQTKLIT